MKYILIVCLVVVVMLISQGVCKQYRERFALYCALNDFFRQMRLNLGFQKQKIKQILDQATLKRNNKEIYTAYYNYLDSGKELSFDFVCVLNETEQQELSSMLLSLGKNDALGELKQLDAYDVYLRDKIELTKQEKNKYCPLITKLSLLGAIGLAIILL